MARALSKVHKQISKKRNGKTNNLHENSRDAKRLRAAGAREEKLNKMMDAAVKQNQVYVIRVAWFKSALEGSVGAVSDEELHLLTQSFIDREDEQLAEAQQQRRPGRPPSKLEEQIKLRKDSEEREFRGGLWVPELRTQESRSKLERWNGEWDGLNTLEFVRVVRNGEIKPSSFPPKGLS
ncbi:translation machinery-associated protein 16 [Elasticomyces elasticus]|uniref:Translation machinery-associated protein 16 n=1 Tax=Exophiala sideris TaxID=1016849 RepID=A0A0D1W2B6_9EURO|nr:translation machinery-associated protein 16 [Elasticomyces elasticus]KAK5022658.1 translation machinery-associated protein 16 [Exophiala sideris]KAK5177968.1 translation machinery-associated protein 16 [Eurotiomycetes sp. CCFEE 6388]KAK5027677.1 translation machinery-associated protein 16 [Exophiala sideris]KAK5052234.1 translation machinery-associated protein 16 [Exophiala sideris]